MTTYTIDVEHNGETYRGYLARVDKTTISVEDHGILTASLDCDMTGRGSVGVGMLMFGGNNALFGPWVKQVLETLGLDVWERGWEAVRGSRLVVLFKDNSLNGPAAGIASLGGRVLVFDDFFAAQRAQEDEKAPVA